MNQAPVLSCFAHWEDEVLTKHTAIQLSACVDEVQRSRKSSSLAVFITCCVQHAGSTLAAGSSCSNGPLVIAAAGVSHDPSSSTAIGNSILPLAGALSAGSAGGSSSSLARPARSVEQVRAAFLEIFKARRQVEALSDATSSGSDDDDDFIGSGSFLGSRSRSLADFGATYDKLTAEADRLKAAAAAALGISDSSADSDDVTLEVDDDGLPTVAALRAALEESKAKAAAAKSFLSQHAGNTMETRQIVVDQLPISFIAAGCHVQ
jgi:hypothetical protein